jgi:acylaminoacyl-peptidase
MSRPLSPEDLYRLRTPTEPRLSPDGHWAVVTLRTVAPTFDGYRDALWLLSTSDVSDAPSPRPLTLGVRRDWHPRFSPDGRMLAFLSDRRAHVEDEPERASDPADREDAHQVHLISMDGPGEARRLTDLPRGVSAFEWSPDGTRLVAISGSVGATHKEDARRRGKSRASSRRSLGEPPPSDYRYIDRLDYMLNGVGFRYDRITHLWLVDVATGAATRLTDGPVREERPAWSPDGRRIAFVANRRRDADIIHRSGIHVVDVATRVVSAITSGSRAVFTAPTWMPDGGTIAALGHRQEGGAGSRQDIHLFAADGSDATSTGGRNLSARHDLMPGASMNSDVTVGEAPRLWVVPDGSSITFSAPIDGSYEIWRIATSDGAVTRVTEGRHYISGWDAVASPRSGARSGASARSRPRGAERTPRRSRRQC